MAWPALLLIVVAFGGMALAFGRSERAEERRLLARAEAVLARGATSVVVPARGEGSAPGARGVEPARTAPGRAPAPAAPGAPPGRIRSAA
jgi:hypothetical protein